MSKLTDLLRQVERKDPQLAADLEREYKVLSSRRAFGLNFEKHYPESTEIPGRAVRKGEKVRILPPRGSLDAGEKTLWVVQRIERVDGGRVAHLVKHDSAEHETCAANVDDLVVVAIMGDCIYPGLVPTSNLERGGNKPFHTVIEGENYHALEALTYTHRGKIDAIYIDPPYNTGAKDWKYNNDYVEGDDLYRHSKWLAFMERRLHLAKKLLNPKTSVLIITIDEKEYLRLGLLLEQTFPEARIQMISTVINPKGVSRGEGFRRSDEYIYFVMFGNASPARMDLSQEWATSSRGVRKSAVTELRKENAESLINPTDSTEEASTSGTPGWTSMMRRGSNSARSDRYSMFYPIYVDPNGPKIAFVGDPLPPNEHDAPPREGLVAVLPLRRNGSEGRWQVSPQELRQRINQGRVRLGRKTAYGYVVNYLPDGSFAEVMSDRFEIEGYAPDGSIVARRLLDGSSRVAPTQWKISSHNASEYGSTLLGQLLPSRPFPFPKSLYAVEDALRFFVKDKPDATILDFFAGSGTTAHAVMRLNHQDGGERQCISVTNNEMAANEQKKLRKARLRPGDPEWERLGICDYITKPRLQAAITGRTPKGNPIKGEYKFIDEFPISKGIEENARFFALTYETRTEVAHNKAFRQIASLLWLRAGARGECIETEPEAGWALADAYGVLINLDASTAFVEAVEAASGIGMVYIVTDDERRFQAVTRRIPDGVEAVRLYESYLRNFQIRVGG